MSPRVGSLFSGYGGLEMGVQAVLGGTTAWHCDVDPGASKILAHHWPDVPNLGDITTVDWARVEPVDVVTGGSPCQDVSHAGARRGMRAGTRSGLWASMCDAIDIIRPGLVVWENVRGVLSAGADSNVELCPICVGDEREAHLRALGRVVGDLAELGYVGRWTGLRAADVGAPHGRFRVFVVAWPAADTDGQRSNRAGLHRPGERGWSEPAHRGLDAPDADRSGLAVRLGVRGDHGPELAATLGDGRDGTPAHAARDGWNEGRPESAGVERGSDVAQRGATAADPDGDALREQPVALAGCGGQAVTGLAGAEAPADADVCGRERVGRVDTLGRDADGRSGADVAWGDYEPAVRRWEAILGRHAPAPTEPGRNSPRLSPAFVEWLMGLPAGHVTDVPGLSRNDQLKALGNGVVPQQAARALERLLEVTS